MSVREAVVYLTARGYRCSAGTVRALARAGKVKYFRPGVTGKGPMSFTAAQLDDLLRAAEFGPKDATDAGRRPREPRPKPSAAKVSGAAGWREELERELGS